MENHANSILFYYIIIRSKFGGISYDIFIVSFSEILIRSWKRYQIVDVLIFSRIFMRLSRKCNLKCHSLIAVIIYNFALFKPPFKY